jgi:hypothetical protein
MSFFIGEHLRRALTYLPERTHPSLIREQTLASAYDNQVRDVMVPSASDAYRGYDVSFGLLDGNDAVSRLVRFRPLQRARRPLVSV